MTTATYLVLGSTGGIGRVLCERLAKRGASLALGGRDPEKLNELAARTGGKVCPGDARDATVVDEAVAFAVERFDRLDGAVNLVGSILLKPAHLTKPREWSEVIAINLGSALHLVRSAAKVLVSGLCCALHLQERGFRVLLSEARARVATPSGCLEDPDAAKETR